MPDHRHDMDRRSFLHRAGRLTALGAAAPLGLNLGAMTLAAAQSSGSDYQALVCIFLAGGNDAFNTVLATDTTSWAHYNAHRKPSDGSIGIALPAPGVAANAAAAGNTPERLGGVLPIPHAGRAVHADRQFALHPALTRTQQIYQSGRMAVVANVGPLTRPTTKADYANATASKPAKLFSHNDQQSTWQTFYPEGAAAGWGGLMGDALRLGNGAGRNANDALLVRRMFTCMTPTGAGAWLAGREVLPYQSSTTGIQSLGSAGKIYDSSALQTSVATMLGGLDANGNTPIASTNLFVLDHQQLVQRALQANTLLSASLSPLGIAPWSTTGITNPGSDALLKYTSPVDGTQKFNGLAAQLQMVARMIDLNRTANLGMSKQFFMVSLGGFDTHDNQVSDQAERLAQLDHALAYFDNVLGAMPGTGNMRNNVTTFTASDFGRTFTSNGDGTDHGWGAHHLVMGGSVIGTEVYGTFPRYSTADAQGNFNSADQIQNGALIPTTSVDQFAYTLGKWMGVSTTTLAGAPQTGAGAMLPNLFQFDGSSHDLGFMRS